MSAVNPTRIPVRASQRQLADWRKLTTKKGRRESGRMIIEGVRMITDALAATVEVEAIVFSDTERGHVAWRSVAGAALRKSIPGFTVPERELEKVTDTVHAAGFAAVIKWTPQRFSDAQIGGGWRRTLVCDRVADPGNVGTLIRTAAALGFDAVFLTTGTAELANPKTVRAAAGAVFQIPVFEQAAPLELVGWAKRNKRAIVVADAHRGKPALEPVRAWMLVIGGETLPLDSAWAQSGALWISLPLQRNVESLNAAVAGAILMDRLVLAAGGS